MGLFARMEGRNQRMLLVNALDTSWLASVALSELVEPPYRALPAASVNHAAIDGSIAATIGLWSIPRLNSDRLLSKNRQHYRLRPHQRLSPLLEQFVVRLVEIQADHVSQPVARLDAVFQAILAMNGELTQFRDWIRLVGPEVDFDTAQYEDESLRRAAEFWKPYEAELAPLLAAMRADT